MSLQPTKGKVIKELGVRYWALEHFYGGLPIGLL